MTEPTNRTTPATHAGTTKPAGAGVDDAELAKEVAEQTANDLAVEGVFEAEADGASSDTEAAKDPS
jgi:protease I